MISQFTNNAQCTGSRLHSISYFLIKSLSLNRGFGRSGPSGANPEEKKHFKFESTVKLKLEFDFDFDLISRSNFNKVEV